MNDGVIGIVFSLVYVSLKEFGVVGSDMYTWGIKDFHKFWSGSLAKGRLPWACRCNKLHSTICIVLLSKFVSWNVWLQQGEKMIYFYNSCDSQKCTSDDSRLKAKQKLNQIKI